MTGSRTPPFDAVAICTLAAIEPKAALAELLDAWRRSHDPHIGEAVMRLGARVTTVVEDLPSGIKPRATALGRAVARASDGDLSGVLAEVEPFVRSAGGATTAQLIEACTEREPDPRIAYLANRLLLEAPLSTTLKLNRRLLAAVERHGDPGVSALLRDHPALGPRVGRVRAKLAKRCPVPIARSALAALLPDLVDPRPNARLDGAALFAEILDAPDEDGPRAVYADWLVDRGDPRGEWIHLQLAKASRSVVATYLAKHRAVLLGPFARCVKMSGLRFSRGFLAGAIASASWPEHPENSLLERVNFERGTIAPTAHFARLTGATVHSAENLRSVLGTAPRLDELRVRYLGDRMADELAACGPRPLHRLRLDTWANAAMLQQMIELPLASAAAELRLHALNHPDVRLAALLGVVPRTCNRLVVSYDAFSIGYALTRVERGWDLAIEAEGQADSEAHRRARICAMIESALIGLPTTGLVSIAVIRRTDSVLAARIGELASSVRS